MRVLFCVALLSSLLCGVWGQALTIPTTDPEDYRITHRTPPDCAPSECSFFAGVQTNQGDSSYLDFYLEGSAMGWIAIGVSASQDMFDADVLGCNVLSGGSSVVAVDTWNPNSRANDLDSTQNGLTQHSSSFEGGRIICSFSRTIAAMDAGQDLNLNADYFVLYATGSDQAASAASPLTPAHSPSTRAVTTETMNLVTDADPTSPPVTTTPPPVATTPPPVLAVPTTDPEDYRLTFRRPPGCAPSVCSFFAGVQTNENSSAFLDFYLEAPANGWAAIGVSASANMFNADVLGCNVLSGDNTVVAVDTWNPNARANNLDNTQNGLTQHNSSFEGGRIICSFSRSIAAMDAGQDLNLDGDYFVLYAVGEGQAASAASPLTPAHDSQSRGVVTPTINLVTNDPTAPPEVPTTAPEDYRLTFRRPPGCVPSECSFFAGVQTNDNSAYLDFYLEGDDTGWLAIGVSETQDMFSADVLGCNVFSGDNSVVAVDTWNRDGERFNVQDDTQEDLMEHSTSFVDGRITCNFSRTIAVLDPGQDLNLNGNYFVLYGTGNDSAPSLASGLSRHSLEVFPAVSGSRMNLATDVDAPPLEGLVLPAPPTRTPADSRLIISDPSGCDPSTCNTFIGISTNENNSSFFDFYIEGAAAGWVAVGFSETQSMFSADVLGCNVVAGTSTVEVVDTWNVAANGRLNIIDSNQAGLAVYSADFVDGRISCSFSRFAGILNEATGPDLDLSIGEYFIMFGVGQNPAPAAGSALGTHRPQSNPALTGRINVAQAGGQVAAEITTRQRLIRAHGILMIIAWPVLAMTAIFFAAWMKPALPNGEWFQVHRAFLIASLFVGAAGFILIFVAYRDNDRPGLITFTDNPTGTAHFVIGIIIMALHIANPIIAIFRCKPDGEHRWIFNLIHASTIGLLVELLALTNIGLGTNIFGPLSRFEDDTIFWVYIGYLIFFVVLTLGLFILFTILSLTGDSEDRAKTSPSLLKPLLVRNTGSMAVTAVELTAPGALPTKEEPPQRKPASQDAPIRWVALCIFLSVMLPVMITLIVLIALDPEL